MSEEDEEAAYIRWDECKARLTAEMLGPEHDMVLHAIIPYAIGGALDLYYYPNGIPGTGIATRELSEAPGAGSSNDAWPNYELVMFTKAALDLDAARDEKTPFGRMHQTIAAILNPIARYSADASLNPNETCEFPADMPEVGGKCLIFAGYASRPDDDGEPFGLLAVIEVFRSEMEFAQKNGGAKLLARLKDKGHYPYSDLFRQPVA